MAAAGQVDSLPGEQSSASQGLPEDNVVADSAHTGLHSNTTPGQEAVPPPKAEETATSEQASTRSEDSPSGRPRSRGLGDSAPLESPARSLRSRVSLRTPRDEDKGLHSPAEYTDGEGAVLERPARSLRSGESFKRLAGEGAGPQAVRALRSIQSMKAAPGDVVIEAPSRALRSLLSQKGPSPRGEPLEARLQSLRAQQSMKRDTPAMQAEQLQDLSKQNDTLELEIKLYTDFLTRNRRALPTATESPGERDQDFEGLTSDERCEIAGAEVDAAEAVVAQMRKDCEAKVADARIQLRQLDADVLQAERDAFDFKRTFARNPAASPGKAKAGSSAHQSAPVSAEKLLSYLEAQQSAKGLAIEKAGIKLAVNKDQGRKLELQLEQHTVGGMAVGAVDYEKLRIENQQQSEILRKRNAELPRLRLSAGRATQELRSQQVALKEVLGGIQSLRQALQQSQQQTEALQASITRTATSSGPLGLPPSSLQASDASGSQPQPWPTADETPPPILDYVKLTKENQELTAKLTEMERKYETATSLTKKVMTSMPRAARLNASLLSPTRTGLRA